MRGRRGDRAALKLCHLHFPLSVELARVALDDAEGLKAVKANVHIHVLTGVLSANHRRVVTGQAPELPRVLLAIPRAAQQGSSRDGVAGN